MFKAFDFIYDGTNSSAYNLKLLRIEDNDGYTTGTGVPTKSFTMVKTNLSTRKYIVGLSVDDTISFKIQILIDRDEGNPVPIPRNCVSVIRNWLFNQTNFKKLQIIQEDLDNCYFNAVFTEVTDLMLEGEIIGFETTVVTDNTGMYKKERFKKNVSTKLSFPVLITTSSIYTIKPKLTITFIDSNVSISINNRKSIFTYMYPNTTITIDSETLILNGGENDLYNGNFNYVFPELDNGKNLIEINGSCSVTFEYDSIIEVGV